MRFFKKLSLVLPVMLILFMALALADGKLATPTDLCNHPSFSIKYDETMHWTECDVCGQIRGQEDHREFCDKPGHCNYCDAPYQQEYIVHVSTREGYDDVEHWTVCDYCGEYLSRSEHYAFCDDPNHCHGCGIDFVGEVGHDGYEWHHDKNAHWAICIACGEKIFEEGHCAECNNRDAGVCSVCGEPYTGDNLAHVLPSGQGLTLEYDELQHWWRCPTCHEKAFAKDHFTDEGDPEGICTGCGMAYTAVTATPAPAATATPAPAKQPANAGVSATAEPTATPKPELDSESFLARFQGNSADAAAGELLTGEANETVTLTMDADETSEASYDGSVLTIFGTASRADGVAICLTSKYEPEAILSFESWQESVEDVEALRATESFRDFVDLARALVSSLLTEQTEDEIDGLILALLQSGEEGALEELDLTVDFDEDIDGEIIGYLAQDGYEFFLVLREDSVELLVREIEA